jgi:thiamine pyrophosphokinase
MGKRAVLFANGSFDIECIGMYESVLGEKITGDELIIAVDGGVRHVEKLGLYPDVMLGDFDSISNKDYYFEKFSRASVVELERMKDNTDMDIAIQLAIREGCDSLALFGATGSRLDHTLSNIFLIFERHGEGVDINVIDKNNVFLCVDEYNGSVYIRKNEGCFVSIVPVTPLVLGVSTCGMKYELSKHDISFGSTFGISNEVVSDSASISIEGGKALVIVSKD